MNKFLARLTMFMISACITYVAVLIFDRRPVLLLDASLSFITPSPAVPGKPIYITWAAKPMRSCEGVVVPRIIDSTGRIYEFSPAPTVYTELLIGEKKTFVKTLTLPTVMTSGQAKYQAIVYRWCNKLQYLFWPMIDAPFPILFDVEP